MNKKSTTQRVAKAAHDAIEDTAAKAEPLELQLREKASNAGDKVEAGHEATQQQVEQTIASIEKFVNEKPVAAAGVAFAAGIVVSTLLRR